jgi:dTDP-glucose pyrophosphorylase
MNPTIIDFKPLRDDRGDLVAVESGNSIPFDIQRVYYIYETAEGVERGFHAHKALNQVYLERQKLKVGVFNRGIAWLDTGTFASLNEASTFVRVIEERQDTKIGCIEEVAYYSKFINREQLLSIATKLEKSGYGEYLKRVAQL